MGPSDLSKVDALAKNATLNVASVESWETRAPVRVNVRVNVVIRKPLMIPHQNWLVYIF